MKKKFTHEELVRAIETAGGSAAFFRLMEERKRKPGAKLVRDKDGKLHYD